jgi:uncharacterized protein (TIGR02246 family)
MVPAQVQSPSSSAQNDNASDNAAIEKIVHGNPSDHFAEDGSFTNIFGTVRYGREAFKQRHIEITLTIFKDRSVKSCMAKLRFVRSDVAIANVSGEMTGLPRCPQVFRSDRTKSCDSNFLVLVKDNGEWADH